MKDDILQYITIFLYKVGFSKVEKVFFQNNDDRDLFLKKEIVPESKADLLPGSGVDTNKFCPKDKTRSSFHMIFLLIARVIRDKGIMEYIEAAKKIRMKYVTVEFQIMGELGSLNKSAINQDEIEYWQQKGIINYLGMKDDVREFISNADCIVLPSYREGTSKTLLEAASMGKPIITSDVPGCNNIVEDMENGLLCKVKDSKDLAKKMEIMINLSQEKRIIMGNKGRQTMIEKFEESIVIEKYLEAVESIMDSSYIF